jgi:hypothetical protein
MAKSRTGWSERVRELARREYVEPRRGTQEMVRIPFGEFKAKLVKLGFPQSHANQVADKFWRALGLERCRPKGQPRTMESVLVFRFAGREEGGGQPGGTSAEETPAQRVQRAMDKLYGSMKDEIAARGGAEAFIRWVRSEEGEEWA